ncbi:MAG: ribonuclease HI family protein [Elusimicrobiota bacterium]|nr:ribonuclease HI family protein [Elusimicrobiota bacterium]
MTHRIYTDGGCRGNPGPAAAGIAILDSSKKEIYKSAIYLGQATNNIAEYSAVLEGMRAARRLKIKDIEIYTDSQLVIRQLDGLYKVKSLPLKEIFITIKKLETKFSSVKYVHLKREHTQVPHNLAEEMLDNNP